MTQPTVNIDEKRARLREERIAAWRNLLRSNVQVLEAAVHNHTVILKRFRNGRWKEEPSNNSARTSRQLEFAKLSLDVHLKLKAEFEALDPNAQEYLLLWITAHPLRPVGNVMGVDPAD